MLMTNKLWHILGCLALCLCLVGCGASQKSPKQAVNKRVVTDCQGVKVSVPEHPQRVVSLAVSSDEMLLELLPPENIVGITKSTDRKELSNAVEKAKLIKGRIDPSSPESILKLQPDLVIVPNFVRQEVISTLRDTGLIVYVYPKQNSFAEVKASIKELAQLVNRKPDKLLSYMEQKEALLRDRLKGIADKDRKRAVYLMTNGVYSNPNSPYQDICRYAKVVDASMELKLGKKTHLSKEQLVKLNPEVIIVTDFNWDGKTETSAKIRDILEDKALKEVRAVKDKKIVALPGSHIYALSHHIIDASEDLARAVYPECFK